MGDLESISRVRGFPMRRPPFRASNPPRSKGRTSIM